MLKKIRISILATTNDLATIRLYLGVEDETKYGLEFENDEASPDYIIVTEHIYYREDLFHKFNRLRHRNPNAILIFRAGECISPDMNLFDYAIVFDRNLTNGDRICRISFNRMFSASLLIMQKNIDYKNILEKKNKFCNFLYYNAEAHSMRDRLFFEISKYKQVDALGKHLNNTGIKSTRNSLDWRMESIEIRSPYKFSIAAENATFPGYVSEKLISCLQAATVPIYWGDPTVTVDFNQEAFINCHNYTSLDEVIAKIREIDEDDAQWYNIVTTPWHTDEQLRCKKEEDKAYIEFLMRIFGQEVKAAKRLGIGYHPGRYRDWFENGFGQSYISKLKSEFVKIGSRFMKN